MTEYWWIVVIFFIIFGTAILLGVDNQENIKKPHRYIGPIDAIILYYKNILSINGRTSRGAFWWGLIPANATNLFVNFIFGYYVLGAISNNLTQVDLYASIFSTISSVLLFFPISIRRLQDCDKSGFNILWVLTIFGVFYLWILYASQGSKGTNRYGEDEEKGKFIPDHSARPIDIELQQERNAISGSDGHTNSENDSLQNDDVGIKASSVSDLAPNVNATEDGRLSNGANTLSSQKRLMEVATIDDGSTTPRFVYSDERRECPVCAELIRMNAKKCRFCGADAEA